MRIPVDFILNSRTASAACLQFAWMVMYFAICCAGLCRIERHRQQQKMSLDIGRELEEFLFNDLRKIVLEYIYLPILSDQERLKVLNSLPYMRNERVLTTSRLCDSSATRVKEDAQNEHLYDKMVLYQTESTYLLFQSSQTRYSTIHQMYIFWTPTAKYVCFSLTRMIPSWNSCPISIHLYIHTDLDELLAYVGAKHQFYATARLRTIAQTLETHES